VTGLDAYATIYADSRKWLQSGWVDYLAPQLYWSIASPGQSYPALLDWWISQNTLGRGLWPGLAAYRVQDGTANQFARDEIANQITLTRTRSAGNGQILYNTKSTLGPSGLVSANDPALARAVAPTIAPLYVQRALVPAAPWLDSIPPGAPTIVVTGRSVQVTPAAGEIPRWWWIRYRGSSVWKSGAVFGTLRTVTLDVDPDWVLVNAVDQAGNTSQSAEWKR
jgi:hypothetical protein